ncbi:MAG: aa3-type cytochrome c oxidase subunit IV [Caulobacteraceae bacterium]
MADTHSDEYRHGEMNAATQVADFRIFASLTKWFALHIAVLILVLTLWFCVGASFLGGLIPGLIVLGLGIAFLRNKRRPVH